MKDDRNKEIYLRAAAKAIDKIRAFSPRVIKEKPQEFKTVFDSTFHYLKESGAIDKETAQELEDFKADIFALCCTVSLKMILITCDAMRAKVETL